MNGKLRRIVSVVISIALVLTMSVTSGFAEDMAGSDEPQAASAVETVEEEAAHEETLQEGAATEEAFKEEVMTYTYCREPGEDEESNEELFEKYVESHFFSVNEPTGGKKLLRRNVYLEGLNEVIYSKLKSEIALVADGTSTSTVFEVTAAELGIANLSWTAADLGLPYLTLNGQLTTAAKEAIMADLGIDTDRVLDALMADCPYELYWYDKTRGTQISGPGFNYNNLSVRITSGFTFSFRVVRDYASGTYQVNRNSVERARYAAENAAAIVSEAEGLSDYEKLLHYKNMICGMVSYDEEALNPSVPYGDQWQLISVFDYDYSTNVVCEGYSKAFKYLCDLSDFDDPDAYCITVTGTMTGGTGEGDHMWNMVIIEGGCFLVDVTNCDEGTIGEPVQLFLVGNENGSPAGGYTFNCEGVNVTYRYDQETLALYAPHELELGPLSYTGPTVYMSDDGMLYSLRKGSAVFMGYENLPSPVVFIPEEVDGYPVTAIGNYALFGWNDLTDVYIPRSVTSIGMEAFANSGLRNIHYQGDFPEWQAVAVAEGAISDEIWIELGAEADGEHIFYNNLEEIQAPTCTEAGIYRRYCVICGEPQDFEEPALGHDLIHHEGQAPTCTEDGWAEYDTCSRCDHTTYTAVEATGHTLEVIEAVPATCTEDGLSEGSRCAVCGEIFDSQMIIFAYGHDFHEIEGTAVAPTCTTDGKEADMQCSRCGEIRGGTYLYPLGHMRITSFEAYEPTCEEPGSTAGSWCEICGEILVQWEEIPATGHSWGEWIVIDEATEFSEGLKKRVCENDPSHEEYEIIPKLAHALNDDNVSLSQDVFIYDNFVKYIDKYVLVDGVSPGSDNFTVKYYVDGEESSGPSYIGEVTAVITGKGDYTGTATETYRIVGDLSKSETRAEVTIEEDEFEYAGSPVEPTVTSVTAKGKKGQIVTLEEGVDYEVTYTNNNAAGTGYVVITGVSGSLYTGEKTIPFTIRPQVAHLTEDDVRIDDRGMLVFSPVSGATGYDLVLGEYSHYQVRSYDSGYFDVHKEVIEEAIKRGDIEKPADNIYNFRFEAYNSLGVIAERTWTYEYVTDAEYVVPVELELYHINGRLKGKYEGADRYMIEVLDDDGVLYSEFMNVSTFNQDMDVRIGMYVTNRWINEADVYHLRISAFKDNIIYAVGEIDYIPGGERGVESIVSFDAAPRFERESDDYLFESGLKGDTVTLRYLDGNTETFVYSFTPYGFKSDLINAETDESRRIKVSYDADTGSFIATYTEGDRVLTAADDSAVYTAKSIAYSTTGTLTLTRGENSTTKTDAQGNRYEEYTLEGISAEELFRANDTLTVTYENDLGDTKTLEYVYVPNFEDFELLSTGEYYTGYSCDCYLAEFFSVEMPDQSTEHLKAGQTYNMDLTYAEGSQRLTTTGKPYPIAIEGSEAVLEAPVITASLNSNGKPVISWAAVDGAAKYDLYKATSPDGQYTRLILTVKNQITHTGAADGTTYYYKAMSVDAEGNTSDYSNVVSITPVKPLTPPALTASLNSSGKPVLTWNAVDGAAKYDLWKATSPDGPYTRLILTVKNQITHTGAADGTTYYYKAMSVDANGNTSAYGNVVSITAGQAMTAPAISVSLNANGKPVISWNAVDGAAKYDLWKATSPDGPYTRLILTVKNQITHTGAVDGTTYYYKAMSVDANGNSSAYGNVVSITPGEGLAAPTVKVSLNANGKPVLSWDAMNGAAKYDVYKATSPNGTYTRLILTVKNQITHTGAVDGNTYYYKVKSVDANGNTSDYGNTVSITAGGQLVPPTVTASLNANGKPVLSWDAVPGAAKYDVYKATSPDGQYTRLILTVKTQITHTGAIEGNTYYYKVMSVDADGNTSDYSSVLRVTV